MPLNASLDSLSREPPPANIQIVFRAVWRGLRGDWEQAHEIAQDDDAPEGAWVHALLRRIEGDAANASCWYRRAGRPIAAGDTRHEGETIAETLLDCLQSSPAVLHQLSRPASQSSATVARRLNGHSARWMSQSVS